MIRELALPRALALAAAGVLALPGPLGAAALTDLLMAPHVFDAAPPGVLVTYTEERTVPEAEGTTLADVRGGTVRLEAVAGGEMRLVRGEAGREVPVGTFPAGTANPVLLYFLENGVRAMAEATGGSPFYIRNRIREALAASDLGTDAGGVHEVTLHPFAHDPNLGRMGVFGGLGVRLRFDPAAPARIVELSADTQGGAGGYHDRLVLVPEE